MQQFLAEKMGKRTINKKRLDSTNDLNKSMLAIAILAAGKGTRMKSTQPKVLQKICGKTLIERVINNCSHLKPDRKFLIVGHEAQKIQRHLSFYNELEFVLQEPQNGTGHAVQQLLGVLKGFSGDLLILNGDSPLLKPETIKKLLNKHREKNAEATLLTASLVDPKGYGRVFANKEGTVKQIIEELDCSQEQKKNKLINSGAYCFNWNKLAKLLPELNNKNSQAELYLTDIVEMFSYATHVQVEDPLEVAGINDRIQLATCEALIQERLREKWMRQGVSFTDPSSCTLSEDCIFDIDVIVEPQTHFRGDCRVGKNCRIGPGCLLENSSIGDNVKVIHSVIKDTKVGNNSLIGPFAHLRPETTLANNCQIGNFVEIKKSYVGEGTKINHLSYIGDAKLGMQVNVGAGTITANFDGKNKHESLIGDYTKTGANSVLVAPITLGSNVTVGAGSTLTKDVPSGSLAIERTKQLIKSEWSLD